MLYATADRLGRPVGGAGQVEDGQIADSALLQGATRASNVDEDDRYGGGFDPGLYHLLAPGLVRLPVDGDDAPVDAPGRLDLDVSTKCEC